MRRRKEGREEMEGKGHFYDSICVFVSVCKRDEAEPWGLYFNSFLRGRGKDWGTEANSRKILDWIAFFLILVKCE